MRKIANFTRHYPRRIEIQYWRNKGYALEPTPRAPSLDWSWQEKDIARIIGDEINRIKVQGFDAVLIGGLTNVMAYAWYIAQGLGLQVIHARGKKAQNGYVVKAYSKMLAPSLIAV